MSLLKQCSDLHHHSLQNFIIEHSQGQSAYLLYELVQHPQIKTISDKINQIHTIFCVQTYQSAKEKKLLNLLTQKQIKQLKKLSVLNLFESKHVISISSLCQQLDLQKVNLYKLLTEMSSKDLINIKINDQNNKCQILAAKRRFMPGVKKLELNAECQSRLHKISVANKELISLLQRSSN